MNPLYPAIVSSHGCKLRCTNYNSSVWFGSVYLHVSAGPLDLISGGFSELVLDIWPVFVVYLGERGVDLWNFPPAVVL